MKKFAIICSLLVACILGAGAVAHTQTGPAAQAYYLTGAAGKLVKYVTYQQGVPVFGPSTITDAATGTSYSVLKATLTTTAATTDVVTVTGVTTTSKCVFSADNASAATNTATSFVSTIAANAVTVTHTATAGMIYTLLCTPS